MKGAAFSTLAGEVSTGATEGSEERNEPPESRTLGLSTMGKHAVM